MKLPKNWAQTIETLAQERKELHPSIKLADSLIVEAVDHLTIYITDKIEAAGNDYRLAEQTGIPRATIQAALRSGKILALRNLAYRIAAAQKTKKRLPT